MTGSTLATFRVLRALIRKEFLQIGRDRLMLRQIIAMPVIQLIVLSSAATFEVKRSDVYVVDLDRTSSSRAVVERLGASGRFRIEHGTTMAGGHEALLARDANMIVSLPAGFERDILRDRQAQMQLVLNAEDGAAAGVTSAYAMQIIDAYARERSATLMPATGLMPRTQVHARAWYNPELRYRHYMIPGLLIQLVTVVGTLLTAMNIVREKELGTLDQLSVTPLDRGTFIAAKLIPLWMIAIGELAAGLLVARALFGVPIEGSVALVFLGASVYLIAALGVGLWVSTLANTQQQAMFVTFFIVMIYLLMSGLFTPVRSMPDWAQWLAEANPVKHIVILMRAVMLKGAGIADVARELAILASFGAIMLTLAVRQHARQTA